jgi:hypothetical protein
VTLKYQSGIPGFGHRCENLLCEWVGPCMWCAVIGRDMWGKRRGS